MNYLEELSLELDKLKKGDFVKVNIHLNINGDLLNLCQKINDEISKTGYNFIKFGKESILIPHISLFMGYINSYEQFEFILNTAYDFALSTDRFRIDPTRLHIAERTLNSSKYVLLDLLQNEEIFQKKKFFDDLLHAKIKPMEWDFLNTSSHITVGCFDKTLKHIEQNLNKYYEFPYCEIKDIGISISGKKGMCFGNLKTYDLCKVK